MIDSDCNIHPTAQILFPDLVNIYGATIGAGTRVGPFVELQRDTVIGRDVNFQHHSYAATGTVIGDRVFVGPGVGFTNDDYPTLFGPHHLSPPVVENDVSIGANAVINPGVRIGEGSMIGAGAVVTKDVPPWSIVVGIPARVVRTFAGHDERHAYLHGKVAEARGTNGKFDHSHALP